MDFTKPKSTPTMATCTISTPRIELLSDGKKRICILCGFINDNPAHRLFKNVFTKTPACFRIENVLGIEVPSLAQATVICKTCDKNIAKMVKHKQIIERLSAEYDELHTEMIKMYETGIDKLKSQFGITISKRASTDSPHKVNNRIQHVQGGVKSKKSPNQRFYDSMEISDEPSNVSVTLDDASCHRMGLLHRNEEKIGQALVRGKSIGEPIEPTSKMDENHGLAEGEDKTLTEQNISMTDDTEAYHTCPSCCKTFRLLSGLTKHMKTHEKGVSTEIKVETSVSTQSEIEVETDNSVQNEIKVELDAGEFAQSEIKVEPSVSIQTEMKEEPGDSSCEVNINCWSQETLAVHMEKHQSKQTNKRTHEVSESEITVASDFEVATIDSAAEVQKSSKMSKATASSLECSLCRFYARDKRQLSFHLRTHPKCARCKVPFMDQYLLEEHNIEEKYWKCSVCNSILQDGKLLMEHMRAHLWCSVCLLHFGEQAELQGHMKSPHCLVCKGQFDSQQLLDEHMKVHPQCVVCLARFMNQNRLKSHMKTHPKCANCNVSFMDQQSLEEHNIKEEHWKCSVCESILQDEAELKLHVKSHCLVCKVHSNSLDEHMKVHPQCRLCLARFMSRTLLKSHMKSHPKCAVDSLIKQKISG